MKKIIFPVFNRVHEARQKLLLDELSQNFKVCITTYGEKNLRMSEVAIDIANKFQSALDKIQPDLALIRGDRYEMLIPTVLCAYNQIPIAHIEGGDLSGEIDNKIRHAITQLADIHFATSDESFVRLIQMGTSPVKTYCFGSLDVEYAFKIASQTFKTHPGRYFDLPKEHYILCLYHEIPGENKEEVYQAVQSFTDYQIIGIKGNSDYTKNPQGEEYEPDEFVHLLKNASCLVGNSSAGLKEASILATPVVNIGSRQKNRLRPHNVIDVPCNKESIKNAIEFQLKSKYDLDFTYYQPETSKRMAEKINELT